MIIGLLILILIISYYVIDPFLSVGLTGLFEPAVGGRQDHRHHQDKIVPPRLLARHLLRLPECYLHGQGILLHVVQKPVRPGGGSPDPVAEWGSWLLLLDRHGL